ncbi:hypothetical protein K8S19_03605 [bacterium]|nr:hypothetical protein [bacterium]
MSANASIKPFPIIVRILMTILAIILIALSFKLMKTLSQPSRYINACIVVEKGPGKARNLDDLQIMNINKYLYLQGPIVSAADEKSTKNMFQTNHPPVLDTALFYDETGAVEILSHGLPKTADKYKEYVFNEPLHFIGWRRGDSGLNLFALAKTKDALFDMLYHSSENWKTTLFAQGLLLAVFVFTIFWLFAMALLSNPSLQLVQLLIVNIIFLFLFYSVLILSAYPLLATLLQTIEIVALANLIFVPISYLLKRNAAT